MSEPDAEDEAEQIAEQVIELTKSLQASGRNAGMIGLAMLKVGMELTGKTYGSPAVATWLADQLTGHLRTIHPAMAPKFRN